MNDNQPFVKLILIVALLLSACSQTTVHLYARYLSAVEITQINKALTAKNVQVKINQLGFPASITQSSLIFSPVIDDPKAVNTVLDSLYEMGWPIHHTSMLFVDNHWYQENSVALMLVPPDVDPQNKTSPQDMAKPYTSDSCGLNLTINLRKNGQYQILAPADYRIDADLTRGTWKITHFPYLTLHPTRTEWPLFFELMHAQTHDQIGAIQMTELRPLGDYIFLGGCTFKFGLRS